MKFTVLVEDDVVIKEPAVIVNAFAIPKVAFADNCNDVPLMVTLKRLAIPLSVDVPVNVATPAEADKLPLTTMPDDTEKFASVVSEPVTEKILKFLEPDPDIVLDEPLIVIVPVVAAKLPLPDKLPVSVSDVIVLTDPLIARFSIEMPDPLIVLPAPVIISVPPEAWLNEPDPVVARLPLNPTFAEKLIRDAATVRLLKFCAPVPFTVEPAPVKVSVPVFPLNVPLFNQLAPIV